MKYIINNLKVGLLKNKDQLMKLAANKLNIPEKDFLSFKIVKESLDARRKNNICFIYSVCVETLTKVRIKNSDIRELDELVEQEMKFGNEKIVNRPIVVGTGPCGLFAALFLAQNGYKPLVLERGEDVENRGKTVDAFWKFGILSKESNVQFGEGGAGTFSDGKLVTRINSPECDKVLKILYENGAPEDILYRAKPHIGSDNLPKVVENIRERIKSLGGEVLFNSKVTDIEIKNGAIYGITVNNTMKIEANVVIMAVGHSSRDTFDMLYNKGVAMEAKPFSIGVRIEHPQELVNKAQYGENFNHPSLSSADYSLFSKIGNRTAYSFCMCPGGLVVASASEENGIVTNGMSEYKRDRENANSAFVVSVSPSDFEGGNPLAGVDFQKKYESMAFKIGGGRYGAPIQKLGDFIRNQKSSSISSVKPSYTGETTWADLNECMPVFIGDTLKEAVELFDRKLKGFALEDAILTGMETRTSSPVRIPRNDTCQSINVMGIFPGGEGAGYAGGITSAAVDGIKIAKSVMSIFKPC
jgi:uncharacterized FAD-dependent dehydrogenase